MDTKVVAGALGEEWKNSVVPVSIAIVKQGFSTKQGVLIHDRLFLLLSNEHSYSKPKKSERENVSVNQFEDVLVMSICMFSTWLQERGDGRVFLHI